MIHYTLHYIYSTQISHDDIMSYFFENYLKNSRKEIIKESLSDFPAFEDLLQDYQEEFKKSNPKSIDTKVHTVWLISFQSEYTVEVFDSEEKAKQFATYFIRDWLENSIKNNLLQTSNVDVLVKNNLYDQKAQTLAKDASIEKLFDGLDLEHDDELFRIMIAWDRRCIWKTEINRGLLKYTEPKPAKTFSFDEMVMGLKEINDETDLYLAQFGHPEQEVSNSEMKEALLHDVEILAQMKEYQDYLIKIDCAEEISQLEVKYILDKAKRLLESL